MDFASMRLAQEIQANLMKRKIVKDESGAPGTTVTYIGYAAAGTAEATAKWMAVKITETVDGTTTTTTYEHADGDSKFDNVATDLSALSYS